MIVLAKMDGLADGLVVCMLLPVALGMLLLFVWWAILGMIYREHRVAQSAVHPTVPELLDLVHKRAVDGWLSAHKKAPDETSDPGVRLDLTLLVEHLLNTENPLMYKRERAEATKTIVDRMLGQSPA